MTVIDVNLLNAIRNIDAEMPSYLTEAGLNGTCE